MRPVCQGLRAAVAGRALTVTASSVLRPHGRSVPGHRSARRNDAAILLSRGRNRHRFFCNCHASALAWLEPRCGLTFRSPPFHCPFLSPRNLSGCSAQTQTGRESPAGRVPGRPSAPGYQAVSGAWTGPDEIGVGC